MEDFGNRTRGAIGIKEHNTPCEVPTNQHIRARIMPGMLIPRVSIIGPKLMQREANPPQADW